MRNKSHCSNFVKIVFWAWWGVFCIGSKNFFYNKVFYWSKEPNSRWTGPESKICILSPPPILVHIVVLPVQRNKVKQILMMLVLDLILSNSSFVCVKEKPEENTVASTQYKM